MHSAVRARETREGAVAARGAAVVAAVFGALAAAAALIGADSGIGRALLLGLLLGAPSGAVAVALWALDPLSRVVCAVVSAVLVNVAVAQTMLALGAWSIPGGVVAVGVLSSLAWFLALLRRDPVVAVTAHVPASSTDAAVEREAGR